MTRRSTFNVTLRIISGQEFAQSKVVKHSLSKGIEFHKEEQVTFKIKAEDFHPDRNVIHAIILQMEPGDLCEYFIRAKNDHSRKIC